MLAEQRGRFLFEVRPDLFPEQYLTSAETALWGLYYDDKKQRSAALS